MSLGSWRSDLSPAPFTSRSVGTSLSMPAPASPLSAASPPLPLAPLSSLPTLAAALTLPRTDSCLRGRIHASSHRICAYHHAWTPSRLGGSVSSRGTISLMSASVREVSLVTYAPRPSVYKTTIMS